MKFTTAVALSLLTAVAWLDLHWDAMSAAPEPKTKVELAPRPAEFSIEGYYSLEGKDANGAYTGIASIRRDGPLWRVSWMLEGGAMLGAGIKQDGILCVGWSSGRAPGVSRFVIEGEAGKPKLVGRWVAVSGEEGEETLTWLKGIR